MTTQIQIHLRTQDMTHEMLVSEGVIGGPFGQLISSEDYFEEFQDLISDAPNVIVGNSSEKWCRDLADAINDVREVDDAFMAQISAIIESHEVSDEAKSVIDFLQEHEGDKVFTIHW